MRSETGKAAKPDCNCLTAFRDIAVLFVLPDPMLSIYS